MKEKWETLADDERDVWKQKEAWDKKRLDNETKIFHDKPGNRSSTKDVIVENNTGSNHLIPKKSRRA